MKQKRPATPKPVVTVAVPERDLAGPEKAVLKVLAEPIRCPETKLGDELFDHFANSPDVDQFNGYTSSNWKSNFSDFSASLVKQAEARDFDSGSLRKALDLVFKDSGELAYLPVGAYQAIVNGKLVWIVTVKWESVEWGKDGLGHIRIFVFDQQTLKQVGFATCS